MILKCKNCGKEFNSDYSKRKFCSKLCYNEWQKGEKNPSKKLEVREKISEKLKGKPKHFKNPEERAKKISISRKGKHYPHKGAPCSTEKKKKISESVKKVMANPKIRKKISEKRKGWKPSEEWKKKMSEVHKGIFPSLEARKKLSEIVKRRWQNKEFREKVIKSLLCKLKNRPTSLEKKAMEIIKKYDLPFQYVGDGSFLIGYKNPDFIHKEKKICLEVCNYFHHPKGYKEKRIDYFAKWGWKCFVFYENELNKLKELKNYDKNSL
jgi:hypothetical protein